MTAVIGDSRLAQRLRREIEGEVLFGRADRGRYATDASIYQVEPIGVIVPRRIEDVAAAMAICREAGIPVLPRGGGTSQCGQTVNRALVIDCSRHLNRVLSVEGDRAWVEPGIVLAQLNAQLRPTGRFFPVDPSTNARCTIGGMAGNNSCGSKSIRYGLMADNTTAIDAILADGSRHRFGPPGANLAAAPAAVVALLDRLRALGLAEADEIAARFPRQLRRVGGYNIDALTPAAQAAGRDNLARLLVGSEGTLAFSAALELALHPIKPRKVLGICQFPTFRAAMAASQHLVTLDPEAVELVDRTMIELGRAIPIYRGTIDRMLIGEPDSVLIVEFHGHEDAALLRKLAELDAMMGDLGYPGEVVRAVDAQFQADIAEVREAGLNIMMSMKGDGKPVSFIEDCAVDLADLADYTERLNDVFARHGTRGTWYAHASVGCLHVRPVLSMKDPADVATMRAVAEECFALVREYKGSHSGEHGDGIVRSEFNEPMFGPRIARAFEAVKDAFDPAALLNPGRVVRPPRMDDRSLFRYPPGYAAAEGFAPALDWSAWPGPLGGMLGAVEMCNNNGTCRKVDAHPRRDRRHPRSRQHAAARPHRPARAGRDGGRRRGRALKLCVACKGCRRECPTGVDMAKFKIEANAARAARHGVALRERAGRRAAGARHGPRASRPVQPAQPLRRAAPPGRADRLRRRPPLPEWRADPFRDDEGDGPGAAARVVLFADTFNRAFRAGEPPRRARACCARPAIASPWN